ncbi:hypothetical protein BH11PSE11_BH11PSE11_04650 [soil metagenome]
MSRYGFRALEIPSMASIVVAKPAPAPNAITTLEKDYPRVIQAITAMWGFPELNLYFDKLTIDERGDREGFPPDVWDDIYTLQNLHHQLVPLAPVSATVSPFRR